MVIRNASSYAATVPTFAPYAQDLTQEVLLTGKNFMLCARKFVKHVLKSVPGMHLIMQVAKSVLMRAKNARKFVQNWLLLQYSLNQKGSFVPFLILFQLTKHMNLRDTKNR